MYIIKYNVYVFERVKVVLLKNLTHIKQRKILLYAYIGIVIRYALEKFSEHIILVPYCDLK